MVRVLGRFVLSLPVLNVKYSQKSVSGAQPLENDKDASKKANQMFKLKYGSTKQKENKGEF